ncbi:MAG: hypothetical protein IPK20_19150 [Betaproteobacteria bacterium]|nr:hypothetical protein [Betaproteobacteria bacterium]
MNLLGAQVDYAQAPAGRHHHRSTPLRAGEHLECRQRTEADVMSARISTSNYVIRGMIATPAKPLGVEPYPMIARPRRELPREGAPDDQLLGASAVQLRTAFAVTQEG